MEKTIIQHIQTDHFSLILRKLHTNTLIIEWEDVMENYHIKAREIEALRKAIENYVLENGPVLLLVKTFKGIVVEQEIQKKLQNKQLFGGIRAVAIELQSTTHRISLNISAQFNRNRIPIRAFSSQNAASRWLQKKQSLLSQKS